MTVEELAGNMAILVGQVRSQIEDLYDRDKAAEERRTTLQRDIDSLFKGTAQANEYAGFATGLAKKLKVDIEEMHEELVEHLEPEKPGTAMEVAAKEIMEKSTRACLDAIKDGKCPITPPTPEGLSIEDFAKKPSVPCVSVAMSKKDSPVKTPTASERRFGMDKPEYCCETMQWHVEQGFIEPKGEAGALVHFKGTASFIDRCPWCPKELK